jgi:DNA polymerase-3 subunit epsilon
MPIYAIIDIETTGGAAAQDRIIEIAIVLHDGVKMIDAFESLIFPECLISAQITKITTITNEMVKNAPKFQEVAKKIVEMTENTIFVAHNAQFDYRFIVEEFKRFGYTYEKEVLCTVKLSRRAFPHLKSHALSNLIEHFNIIVKDRHRAMADVMATINVFERILKQKIDLKLPTQAMPKTDANQSIKPQLETKTPSSTAFPMEKLRELPRKCGVYYLHDATGKIIFIKQSFDIQRSVYEHFSDASVKGAEIQNLVHEVTYQVTGGKLIATLIELHEIERHKPILNTKPREYFPYGVFKTHNVKYFNHFFVAKKAAVLDPLQVLCATFATHQEAILFLRNQIAVLELCEHYAYTHERKGACFGHFVGRCRGACVGKENVKDYNQRANLLKNNILSEYPLDFFVLDEGKTEEDCSLILIENGQYRGYGTGRREHLKTFDDLFYTIIPHPDNETVKQLVHEHLKQNNPIIEICKHIGG